jgi:hypothetical protein
MDLYICLSINGNGECAPARLSQRFLLLAGGLEATVGAFARFGRSSGAQTLPLQRTNLDLVRRYNSDSTADNYDGNFDQRQLHRDDS